MPKTNRIQKNYYLGGSQGRGSLWTMWLSPVSSGANNIYFSGSGYLQEKRDDFGFDFKLSIHKDGRAHIKYKGSVLHRFRLTNIEGCFPICSVYTHIDDLIVPPIIPDKVGGDKIKIDISSIENTNNDKWSELFFGHFDTRADDFIRKNCTQDYGFNVVERVCIGQGREILVMFRYIASTATSGEKPDLSRLDEMSNKNRLTIWGYRNVKNGDKHSAIHDLAPNLERIESVYKKA